MPTGYTAAILDGIEFPQFVMRCARAMGACVMQRDDATDAPIVMDEPSDFYAERVTRLEQEIAALSAMGDADIAAKLADELDAARRYQSEQATKDAAKRAKYEAMLAKVQEWSPPSPDHYGLKKFMIEQITESIRFDCHDDGDSYCDRNVQRLQAMTPMKWRNDRMVTLHRDLASSREELAKEISRTESRNRWKRQLAESVGVEVPTLRP